MSYAITINIYIYILIYVYIYRYISKRFANPATVPFSRMSLLADWWIG